MSEQCVVAVYSDFAEAKSAVEQLEQAGFASDHVSLAAGSLPADVKREEALDFGDQSETGAAHSAGVGGLLGMLLGVPVFAVPGVGPLLLAGPIFAGLTGAVVGGFLGALGGWGVDAENVQEYQQLVQDGKVLVFASGDPAQAAEAERVLQDSPCDAIRVHARTSADSPEITES